MSKQEQFYDAVLRHDREEVRRLLSYTCVDPDAKDWWVTKYYREMEDYEMSDFIYDSRNRFDKKSDWVMNNDDFKDDFAGDDDFHHMNYMRDLFGVAKLARKDYDELSQKRNGLALRNGRALKDSWWSNLDLEDYEEQLLKNYEEYDQYNRNHDIPITPLEWISTIYRVKTPPILTSLFSDECSICLDNPDTSCSYVNLIPCCHHFHIICISKSIQSTYNRCPTCYKKIDYMIKINT